MSHTSMYIATVLTVLVLKARPCCITTSLYCNCCSHIYVPQAESMVQCLLWGFAQLLVGHSRAQVFVGHSSSQVLVGHSRAAHKCSARATNLGIWASITHSHIHIICYTCCNEAQLYMEHWCLGHLFSGVFFKQNYYWEPPWHALYITPLNML